MPKKEKKPPKLTDFKGHPPTVRATKERKDEADALATKTLMDLYTQEDGWHCPKCGLVFTDGDLAVAHLADEINSALAYLGR